MENNRWTAGGVSFTERMPPLDLKNLDEEQRKAAQALIAGPRKAVSGPFVPLLRSPKLVDRLGKVGEYLRFESSLAPRISEFIMLIVSREWTNHFEWHMHVPLARKAGLAEEAISALAEGRRPDSMQADEALVYDFCDELFRSKGVTDETYRRAAEGFGEKGVIDIVAVAGYFAMVSMVMNVAHTPPLEQGAPALRPLPG